MFDSVRRLIRLLLTRLGLAEQVRRISRLGVRLRFGGAREFVASVAGVTVRFATLDEYSRSWFFPRYAGGLLHERAATELLAEALRPAGCFVDVGANLGWYTCVAAKLMPRGEVYSFEMDSSSFALLQRNIALNDGAEVEALNLAVADRAGVVSYRRDSPQPSAGRHLDWGEGDGGRGTVEVIAVSLDEFLAERGVEPDVVKIDVEGAELIVLAGMQRTLHDRGPVLFVEVHSRGLRRFGGRPSEVVSLLAENGYQVFEVENLRGQESGRSLRRLTEASALEGNPMLYAARGADRASDRGATRV